MKAISILLGLMIWNTTLTMAQEPDSIVVTYDNQHTTIQVPAFGKQTTIKMADSIQIIEIGISRRKLSDIVQPDKYPSNAVTAENPIKKVKWYSQIEAGYTMKFYTGPSSETITLNGNELTTLYYNTDNISGYKAGISIFEKERCLSERFSYISGFKIGFAQSFRRSQNIPEVQDTLARIFVGFSPMTTTSLQFLFPLGFRQYLGTGKSGSLINYGANIGSSINRVKQKYSSLGAQSSTFLIIDPFLGFEKGKIGIQALVNLSFDSKYNYSVHNTTLNVEYGIGLSLTYRFF